MNDFKPVSTIQNYGEIKIKLRELMEEKELTRYQLSRLTNTRFEVINKWYNGNVERIDSDVLARLCFTLGCRVEDIIEYCESPA